MLVPTRSEQTHQNHPNQDGEASFRSIWDYWHSREAEVFAKIPKEHSCTHSLRCQVLLLPVSGMGSLRMPGVFCWDGGGGCEGGRLGLQGYTETHPQCEALTLPGKMAWPGMTCVKPIMQTPCCASEVQTERPEGRGRPKRESQFPSPLAVAAWF